WKNPESPCVTTRPLRPRPLAIPMDPAALGPYLPPAAASSWARWHGTSEADWHSLRRPWRWQTRPEFLYCARNAKSSSTRESPYPLRDPADTARSDKDRRGAMAETATCGG